MKVLQITVGESIRGGGIGRIASSLADLLNKNEIESVLASCFEYEEARRNYKFIKIGCIKLPFFSSLVIPLNLFSIIKREKPDLIISHGYSSSLPLFSFIFSKLLGIPHVFAVHSYPKIGGIRGFLMKVYDLLAYFPLKYSNIIYFSRSSQEILKKKGELFLFVPEKEFFLSERDKKPEFLLFVGRLDENKRADWFVEICNSLNEKGFIAGIDEGEGKRLRNLDLKNISIKEVQFSKMPSVYSKARLLITPSKYEGLPLVWLEAVASLTPILTTDVGDAKLFLKEFYDDYNPFIFYTLEEGKRKARNLLSLNLSEKLKKAQKRLKQKRKVLEKNFISYIKRFEKGKNG